MPVTGTVSNLGFGSGILTQDHIDKVKKGEEAQRLSKYKELIEANGTKQKDLTEIKTKLLAFQTAVSSLGDATAFAARKVSSSIKDNPPAELTANAGVALQSMNINVTQLAKKDVYQSKALNNETGLVNASLSSAEKITFFQNGKEYTVTIDKNTTYKDLAEKINTASEGNIVAKIINTGEKPDGYRLSLSSKETGEENAISFYPGAKQEVTDSSGKKEWKYQESNEAKNIFKNLGWELDDKTKPNDVDKNKKGYGLKDQTNHLETAQNAEFTMDGMKMTRPSNTITDLAVGLTLTLNKTGEVNFEVQQDTEALSKAMEDLVTAYNDLITNLNVATDYNKDTKTAGTLNGISEVTSIRSNIISTLFDSQPIEGKVKDENGNDKVETVMLSMQDFGITMTESGTLNFSKSTFDKKIKENPEFTESFFSGVTKYKDIDHKGDFIDSSKDLNSDIEFKPGDFKIVFNNEVFDLGKNKDGTNFKLTGKDAQDRMNNLVAHINSLGIDGLTVKVEAAKDGTKDGFKLSFHSENGSDFGIEGKEDFLKKFGLSQTNITAEPIEGKGIFSKLKTVLQNMTGDNGSLTKYDEKLTNDTKNLKEAQESTQKFIDAKYETMQAQFLKYESILTKLNLQQQTVTGMINSMNQNN